LNNFPFQPAARGGQFHNAYDEFTGFPLTASTGRLLRFAYGCKSFPKILRRVANPVEPFGFMFVQDDLPPPLLDGIRNGLGKEPDLFDHPDNGQANEFQDVHKQADDRFTDTAAIPLIRPAGASRAATRSRRRARGLRQPAV
jgi:hypothetical protein